ncbi:hypothetical protein RB601_000508 [Gaeumannomyces tritici]
MDLFMGPGSIYRPLQGSEIRLVKLKGTRRPDQPIKLELFYAPLDTAKFLALSYQWGKSGETKTISVNGTEFPVFQSLFRALESLYLHKVSDLIGVDVFGNPIPAEAQAQAREDATDTDTDESFMGWWIDAICINQASLTERSEQVPRMGKIYSAAARVVIWPGDSYAFESDHRNAAIADATKKYWRIHRELEPEAQASANDGAALRDLLLQSILKHGLDKPFLMEAMAAIYHELTTGHFSRVWTFQELVLARSSPVVLLGMHCTSLLSLELIRAGWAVLIAVSPYKESISMKDLGTLQAGLLSHIIINGRQIYEAQSPGDGAKGFAARLCTFFHLSSGHRRATDRRDRIFGMLGMANLPTPVPPDIQPDYTRSFEDVAFSYAKFLVRNHGRLDVLAMGVNSLPGYPSWVPDFDPPVGFSFRPGEVQSASSLSADGRCLVARGSLIGTVLVVVPAAFDTFLPDYEGTRDPQSQDAMDAIFSTWSGFLNQIVRPSANLRSVSPELVVREWLEQRRAVGNIDDDCCTTVACLGLTEAAGHACSGALYDALRGLRAYFMSVRYLLLDDGHVLQSPGYQRQDPEPGDVVSAIRGMDELAVLRRLEVDREPEGFRIIDARCVGIAFPFGPVTEDVFTNRAERDFHIW